MNTQRWPVRHPGIGVLYYDSEEEARVAAGTAAEMLSPERSDEETAKIHQRNADHLAEDPGCCQGCEACPPECRDCTGCQRDCECYEHP